MALAPNEAPVPIPVPGGQAVRYYRGGVALWILGIGWGLLVPALILFTGLSAKLRDAARFLGRNWYFTIVAYIVLFFVLMFLADLPLSFYQEFLREHAYGLSNQSFGKWLADAVIGLALSCIAGAAFLWIPYLLLRKSPKRWWLYTGLAVIPIFFFVQLISPIWVDPLFNRFGPMKDRALEAKILALADRAGIEGSRVYEVEKSVDTKKVSAYMTGFLGTRRIVLWDTIIEKMTPEELLFVMGHEMGHYVLGHVYKTIFFLSALILAMLYLAYRASDWILVRFAGRFGFNRLSDIASLPLIVLLFGLFSLVAEPAAIGLSRAQEHEADRFGLEITQTSHAAATAFVKLMAEDLGVPRPFALDEIWRGTHPSLADRIEFCNTYKPWKTGEPLKYGHLFKEVPSGLRQ